MCRWFTYLGAEPALLEDVLIRPVHSILKQIDNHWLPDVHVQYQPSDSGDSPNWFTNVDGYGIGWYNLTATEFDPKTTTDELRPVVFRSIEPPLHDRNLVSLTANNASTCVFAHVRAGVPVVETNNHPFVFGRHLFLHNGGINKFLEIKIPLLQSLSVAARANISGTTDTEHAAALFFTYLDPAGPWTKTYSLQAIKAAMIKTIARLQELVTEAGGDGKGHSSLNFAVTDGEQMVATRIAFPLGQEPPSLYHSVVAGATLNRKYEGHPNGPLAMWRFDMGKRRKKEHAQHVIIASEPTTYDESEWCLIPAQTLVSVGRDLKLHLETWDGGKPVEGIPFQFKATAK